MTDRLKKNGSMSATDITHKHSLSLALIKTVSTAVMYFMIERIKTMLRPLEVTMVTSP